MRSVGIFITGDEAMDKRTEWKARTRRYVLCLSVAALVGASPPAQAQYYSYDGVVFTYPGDLFPINVFDPFLDLRPNWLGIGYGGAGSFQAFAGAHMLAEAMILGGGSSAGDGSFSLSGDGSSASALVELTGSGARLQVGNWGEGSLSVSAGALFDASVNKGVCAGGSCTSYIGTSAGSTGLLEVTGAGSEVRLLGLVVGSTAVFTVEGSGFDLGTPGGTTNVFVNVLAGGTLRTENALVASGNNGGPDGLGTESVNATVLISGAGSQWIVTRDSIADTAAVMNIGSGPRSDGRVTIEDGGKLHIDGTGSSGPNDGINIGSAGKGKLTVTGAGSQLLTTGVNSFINVGANNSLGDGSFEVLAGATASTLYVNVGRNGGSGTMLIDGAGSTLTQSGVGTNQSPGANGPAFAHIGRNTGGGGGTGAVTVSGGGRWIIDDGGGDGRAAQRSPGIAIGRGADSHGTLTITGAGSKVEITSTSLNPDVGVGDNYNPFVGVGYDNPATSSGTLLVSAGGQLILNGHALSTIDNPRSTALQIGGRGNALPGTGSATVTGAGSRIAVLGVDAFISVGVGVLDGQQGTGFLNVLDHATVESTSLVVGGYGIGALNVDNAALTLSGHRTNTNPLTGAGMTVGRGEGGFGTLSMSNGASITIVPTVYAGGLSIGGDRYDSGGTGMATMSGGSSIVFDGPMIGNTLTVGRTGTATLTMTGASFADLGAGGEAVFARDPGGVAIATLSGGSWLRANQIQFGGRDDVNAGGTATVTVTGLGSELRADGDTARVAVGRGGVGTLTVADQAKVSATFLNVGRAAGGNGSLLVDNARIEVGGQKNLGGTEYGAAMTVGTRGGTGVATITNGSIVNIVNAGSEGASLSIGGNPPNPFGTGTVNVSGGSQIKLQAAPGLATVHVGHDGSGTLALSGGSLLDAGDGNVYVAALAGSAGRLELSGNSTLNAGFVGIGIGAAGTGDSIGAPGGTGTLRLDDSTINTSRFELGAGSTLSGNNGVINAGPLGKVIIAGIVSPGDSPGRIRINCDLTMLLGSELILEVEQNGGGFDIDTFVIGDDSTFDLTQMQIVFSFIGDTDPNAFAASGFLLDRFLKAGHGSDESQGLSSLFAEGTHWDSYIDTSFAFMSDAYDVSALGFNVVTGELTIDAVPVPEPATIVLMAFGLLVMLAAQRRRSAGARRG